MRLAALISALIAACASFAAPPKLPRAEPADVGLDASRLAYIDAAVSEGLNQKKMPGCVVLVARKGRIAYFKAFGSRAVKPAGEPMTIDTVFDMASITKPVATATSVMLMLERGQIRLGDRLAEHFRTYLPEVKEGITVQQLLTHTTGFIADNPLADYKQGAEFARKRLLQLLPNDEPGTIFRYSDVNFQLLGELVRAKTGQDVATFAKTNIFSPLGMNETTYLPPESLRKRAVTTEQREGHWMKGEVHDPRAYAMGGVAGHAGLFSTAMDLAVYAQMLHGKGMYGGVRVLGERTVMLFTAPQTLPNGALRTLGWDMRSGYSTNRGETFTGSAFGHGGFTGTAMWIDPELELTVIFLSNRVHPDGKGSVNPLAGRIGTIAASAVLPAARASQEASSAEPGVNPAPKPNVPLRRSPIPGPGPVAENPALPPTPKPSTEMNAPPPARPTPPLVAAADKSAPPSPRPPKPAELGIALTGPAKAKVGESLEFKVAIRNSGESSTPPLVVRVNASPNLELDGGSANPPSAEGTVFRVQAISGGGSSSLSVRAVGRKGGKATVTASAVGFNQAPRKTSADVTLTGGVLTGIEVLKRDGFSVLAGKTVGLVTNHTGVDRDGTATIDLLHKAPGVKLAAIFSPEHGLRGEFDKPNIADGKDAKTGLVVYSLYGKTRKPTAEQLKGIDVLVYDIQDVGARFYTYISTLLLSMEAAAENKVAFLVLDRPNPIGGLTVAGPMLDPGRESFVACHRLPVQHGMTVGELAEFFRADKKLDLDLKVVRLDGWSRGSWYDDTGVKWINPSPNMRSVAEAMLYPGIGLLETTNLSVGRGTDTPFEVIGAPWLDGKKLVSELDARKLPGVSFAAIEYVPNDSKFKGHKCGGVHITISDRAAFRSVHTGIEIAAALRRLYPKDWDVSGYMRLLGNAATLSALKEGADAAAIEAGWQKDLQEFVGRRGKVLLYAD